MTKHKPATPLPWKYNKAVTIHAVSGARRVVCKETHEEARYDLPYLTHAANAYPRLVATLLGLHQAYSHHHSPQHRAAALSEACSLLMALGEL